jgi:hypothetical protein
MLLMQQDSDLFAWLPLQEKDAYAPALDESVWNDPFYEQESGLELPLDIGLFLLDDATTHQQAAGTHNPQQSAAAESLKRSWENCTQDSISDSSSFTDAQTDEPPSVKRMKSIPPTATTAFALAEEMFRLLNSFVTFCLCNFIDMHFSDAFVCYSSFTYEPVCGKINWMMFLFLLLETYPDSYWQLLHVEEDLAMKKTSCIVGFCGTRLYEQSIAIVNHHIKHVGQDALNLCPAQLLSYLSHIVLPALITATKSLQGVNMEDRLIRRVSFFYNEEKRVYKVESFD